MDSQDDRCYQDVNHDDHHPTTRITRITTTVGAEQPGGSPLPRSFRDALVHDDTGLAITALVVAVIAVTVAARLAMKARPA
jgi:hypothetical protein